MDVDELFRLADEAQDVLEQTLTQEERDHLQEIYRNVNSQLLWGRVVDNAFPLLLEMAEELIHTEGMAKDGGPWWEVSEREQRLFDDKEPKAMARQHSLLLLLAKKLLGALKTRVNQSMGDIRVLSEDEQIELEALVEEATSEAQDLDEIVVEDSFVDKSEVVAQVDIAPEGDCRQNGRHVRTTTRWKRKNDDMVRETYCKDCRQVIEAIRAERTTTVPKVCRHPGAEWVEGLEGEEARCTECKETIPDPSTYQWVDAGLEPYGDDTAADEAITLCSDY